MANQSLLYELNAVMGEVVQTGLLSSLASFFDRPGGANPTVNAMGQPDLTTLVAVAGLQNIPCQLAPEKPYNPDAHGGSRLPDHFTEDQDRHLLLDNYYPAILQRFVVSVDGVLYELTPGAIEHDSQKQMTRLAVRNFSL